MTLVTEYVDARRHEDVARLRRTLALRAMAATGMTQRQIAHDLRISQPAVSQQLKNAPPLDGVHPHQLLEAAAPILKALAADRGYSRLAVFGSLARGEGRPDSDLDLIVQAPEATSTFDFVRFRQLLEAVLGREIDLVEYGGLTADLDADIRRDTTPL